LLHSRKLEEPNKPQHPKKEEQKEAKERQLKSK